MKSLFSSNKAIDQADTPLKYHYALPNVNGILPHHEPHSGIKPTDTSMPHRHPLSQISSSEVYDRTPVKPTTEPVCLDLSTNVNGSLPYHEPHTGIKPTDSSMPHQHPLSYLSSEARNCTPVKPTTESVCLDLSTNENSILPHHEPHSGIKSTDTSMPHRHQLSHPSSSEARNFTPIKPTTDPICRSQRKNESTPVKSTIEPISISQKKNESTPMFKKPMSVNSYKSSSAISQEQNHKTVIAKSTVVPPASILKKSQVEASKDVINLNNKQYKVRGELGTGGSSSVYSVEDTQGLELALKVVNLSTITDPSTADGYLKEVHYLEKLQGCPCVIKMYDYEYDTGSKHLYVVMEKGDDDLSKYLRKIKKITNHNIILRVLQHWHDMLLAVKAIHTEGIIHSDLKPANFLFVGGVGGVLKLIDFGIASSLQGDQTSVYKDIASGTLNYMSPESVQDVSRVSYKSDVWSLGCILYNMIYGKTPYSHIPSQWAKMRAIGDSKVQVEFKPNGINNTPVPPVLLDSMKLCLQKDLKARPTVEQLLHILQSWLYVPAIQTPP